MHRCLLAQLLNTNNHPMKNLITILLIMLIPIFSEAGQRHHSRGKHHSHRYYHQRGHAHHGKGRYLMAAHYNKPKVLTEQDRISMQFEAQKGALVNPVARSSDYNNNSVQPFRHLTGNMGTDISCANGANVHAVYDGVVSSVFSVDNDENMIVIVQHGNYFTVYNRLSRALVKKGDHVNTNQELGIVAPNENGDVKLNFQIWKKGQKTNAKLAPEHAPEEWLSK